MSKTISYRVLQVLSLLPILAWPLIAFGTIFIFDSPNANPSVQYLLFYGTNAYPLYLIGNFILSNRLYEKRIRISIGLLLWPIILFGLLFTYIFMN
ncbi:MAG: hypothetical protein ACI8YQ_001865 [Polaribacter sp.]|jgi:hypothetical protein